LSCGANLSTALQIDAGMDGLSRSAGVGDVGGTRATRRPLPRLIARGRPQLTLRSMSRLQAAAPFARCNLWFSLKALHLPGAAVASAGTANGSHPRLRLDALERSR
jgi:hypothetical protein